MDIKNYFESIDLNEIDRFIEEKQEENLFIEFKTVVHPNYNQHNKNDDKKNIAKTISGFANSNGGIIIWGIKAKENENKQDVATNKKPIKELTKFLNLLNRLEGQAVTPLVTGVIHKKLEISDDLGYILTYIPESSFAPHMANYADNHYYKRSGDSFYRCEHYDIRDMFQRKQTAKLSLTVENITKHNCPGRNDSWRYMMVLVLVNEGKNYAKAPSIQLNINHPFEFSPFGIDGNGNVGLFGKKAEPSSSQRSSYVGGQDIVVYQDLSYQLDTITLDVKKEVKELPTLILDFLIVAENTKKTSKIKEINIE